MPDSYPLLHTLIDSDQPPSPGRYDFKAAMELLKLQSVFDIIRLAKTEFIEQLAQYCDDDAGQAYDNACGYAAQLEFLHRERALSDESNLRQKRSVNSEVPIGPTYAALFKEDWSNFCETSSITALDSPAAYLRALHLFAMQVEKTGKGTGKRIVLGARRPTLKDMVIDSKSLTKQLPMLTIVNETLNEHLQLHLFRNVGLYNNKSVNEVLAMTRYPFELPFDLAHQQSLLGLTANTSGLGELNYRMSLKLPLSNASANTYGVVQHPAYEAQFLLSGLSPEQITLLTEPFWTEEKSAFKTHYGCDGTTLIQRSHFMQQTGLNTDQVDELLARGKYRPQPSSNIQSALIDTDYTALCGARFINISGDSTPRIDLVTNHKGQVELLNISAQRFDRLQRMIRLQRWLDLPFAQLDNLLFSAWRCEIQSDETFQINDNTLRVLGIYRYLNRCYGLKADEFSALLYRLPVHAIGNNDSLFDRLFNSGQLLTPPFELDGMPLEPDATDIVTQTFIFQICAALRLSHTAESFGIVAASTRHYNGALKKDLTTLSSFYRQTRIARLFGLSVMECDQLAELLVDKSTKEQWVKPSLRPYDPNSLADFLDLLMHMDWAVNWLKRYNINVQQLRYQLLLEKSKPYTNTVKEQLKRLEELHEDCQTRRLTPEDIEAANLPKDVASKLPHAQFWGSVIVKGLIKNLSKLPPQASLQLLKQSVSAAVDQYVELSTEPELNKQLKTRVKLQLEPVLMSAFQRLQPIRARIEQLFKETGHANDSEQSLKRKLKYVTYLLGRTLDRPYSLQRFKDLLLLIPDAENTLQLPLTRHTLQAFVINPHWLDNENSQSEMLNLSLSTLYLFQAFNHCINAYGLTQDTLLSYFEVSNPITDVGESVVLSKQCNTLLGAILAWDSQEVEVLANRLPTRRVRSMRELEWLMRGHEIAKATGLSCTTLLLTTALQAKIASADWVMVGKAVIAAQKQ
ncbi:Tc toxin subunit A [Pseudomonas sp. SIMBA_077]